ncbi:hypothetical protein VTN00DRAFT_6498 [Thermoascus crustaceus]|uniref:uncharacterized protein n=1 Tax=Thermoascus crustaceus TaxID=5088 RepID=UPI003742FCB7
MGRPHTAQVAAAARGQTSCQGGSSSFVHRSPQKASDLHHHSQDLAFVVHAPQHFRALIGWSILTAPRRAMPEVCESPLSSHDDNDTDNERIEHFSRSDPSSQV